MSYKSNIVDNYKELQSSLEQLQKNVSSELEQIRADKIEIQHLKHSIETMISQGYYLRDNNKVIISAPEIIIGNVGHDGAIISGGSRITLRAEQIDVEGVTTDSQSSGIVRTRAASIQNIAVDPGIDGRENVVKDHSSIINIARSVTLQSENADDLFIAPANDMRNGINLSSDTSINIESLLTCDSKKSLVKKLSSNLTSEKSDLTSTCNTLKSNISSALTQLEKIASLYIDPIAATSFTVVSENDDLNNHQSNFDDLERTIYVMMDDYFATASRLAEVNRELSSLDNASSDLSSKSSTFKTKNTNNQINLLSEYINLASIDGEGNIRETTGAGISMNARAVNITTKDANGKQITDSSINMLSNLIEVSTANPKITESSSEYPAEGDIKLISKNIFLESVDYKLSENKLEETLLTKGGEISMRASTIKGDTTSTDGSNDGIMTLNSKRVEVKSMDVDKESRKDKSMTTGGVMLLNAEKMYVGGTGSSSESDNSKTLQLVSADLGLFGSTTVELQQSKAIVQLSGDKLSVSGSSTAIYGKTSMEDDVTFSGKATGGTGDFKSLTVSTVFNGPSISDGMGAAAGGGGGSLSAKLKQDEIAAAPASSAE